jgi:hypothetical protein
VNVYNIQNDKKIGRRYFLRRPRSSASLFNIKIIIILLPKFSTEIADNFEKMSTPAVNFTQKSRKCEEGK